MHERSVMHMDLDTFFVSVERLLDAKLIGKPVLIGGITDRGVVASCSYEARAFGVHSAMPMKFARQLCPHAIIIRGNSSNYLKYSDIVTEIIREAVPVFEKTSIDEFYADLTGMDRFFGCYKYATELRRKVMKETGLPISLGLSINKTVSKVATGIAKINPEYDHQHEVEPGTEKIFLAPLSIKKIPMVGEKTYQTLRNLGIHRIQTLQEMPMELLENALGENGVSIWKKANGIDNTPVIPFHERKSISTERTFDRDTIDTVKLKGILLAMAENLAYQLRKGQKLTSCITMKLRYSDFQTHTMQCRIPYTSADHTLVPKVMELFERLYNRRLLVRLVGVRYSYLVSGGYQINLFDDTEERVNLYQAMDHIRNRYGDRAVITAAGMFAQSIGRGDNPFDGGPPVLLANRRQ